MVRREGAPGDTSRGQKRPGVCARVQEKACGGK